MLYLESSGGGNISGAATQVRSQVRGCTIGRASFTPEQLKTNLVALIEALNKAKPQGVKGVYMRKISLSSTMGTGVRVDQTSLVTQPQQ